MPTAPAILPTRSDREVWSQALPANLARLRGRTAWALRRLGCSCAAIPERRNTHPTKKRHQIATAGDHLFAMNVHASPHFVPPRPTPPAREPGLYRFLVAARTNALQIWPKAAYEEDVLVTRGFGRTRMLINSPDAIHRVLVDNTANYCRTP